MQLNKRLSALPVTKGLRPPTPPSSPGRVTTYPAAPKDPGERPPPEPSGGETFPSFQVPPFTSNPCPEVAPRSSQRETDFIMSRYGSSETHLDTLFEEMGSVTNGQFWCKKQIALGRTERLR